MFAKLSIRTKITVVVTFLLIANTGSGLFSLMKMSAINASTVDIATTWVPSLRLLGELRAGVLTYRNTLRDHMLAESTEQKQAAERLMQAIVEKNSQIRSAYEKLTIAPEEKALYDEWSRLWSDYKTATDQVIALSRGSVGKVSHEAQQFIIGVVSPLSNKADEILSRDIELNNKGADTAGADAARNYGTAWMLVAAFIVVALIVGVALAVNLVRDVSRGIASIIKPMQALGDGDLTAHVPHLGEHNEMGMMAGSLQIFKEALIAKKAADEAAARDADAKIERGRRVDGITRQFETTIGDIVGTVSSASIELEASASTLTSEAEHAQELTTVVVSASEEASHNVQSVASATEEMGSSINEIGRQVQESARIAKGAVDQAQKTNARVAELARAAARIGDVVELIANIAGQTNLLALNATIEAARAGDAGRGFAVVASEVKLLAEQTAKATGEISQQINGIQSATQESVGAIKDISDTIGRMSEISATIAAAVEEQGAATQEISRNVQEAAKGTMQVSANIVEVQRGADKTGSASSQVLSAARSLSVESNRLKQEVESFLTSVRVA